METGIPITLLFTIIGILLLGLVGMLWGRVKEMEKEIENLKECEKKNYSFRHNFNTVTEGLMNHIESRFINFEKLMEQKFATILEAIKSHDRK